MNNKRKSRWHRKSRCFFHEVKRDYVDWIKQRKWFKMRFMFHQKCVNHSKLKFAAKNIAQSPFTLWRDRFPCPSRYSTNWDFFANPWLLQEWSYICRQGWSSPGCSTSQLRPAQQFARSHKCHHRPKSNAWQPVWSKASCPFSTRSSQVHPLCTGRKSLVQRTSKSWSARLLFSWASPCRACPSS